MCNVRKFELKFENFLRLENCYLESIDYYLAKNLIFFFQILSFLNFELGSIKEIFLILMETLPKLAFWYRQQLLFRFFFYLLNRSKTLSFHRCLQLWAKSGEYGGWGMITVLFLAKNSCTSIVVWAGRLLWYVWY